MNKANLKLALEIALQTKNLNDIDSLTNELKAAGRNVDGLQEASKRLAKAWDELNPRERGQRLRRLKEACISVSQGQEVLADSIVEAGKAADKTDKEIEQLSEETRRLQEIAKAKITLGIDKDDKARKQIEEATKAYELLKKEGNLTSKELARANELHTQKVQKLEQELGKTKPTLSELASELGKLTSSAAGLSVLAKSAMSFEQAMAGVKKTVDGTPEQIQSLSTQIKSLSVELGLSSEAVAEIAAQGGQLGIPIEKLGEFTEMAGKMAVAFDMTAEEAADAAAKLSNVFGIPITEVESLGDAINTLGNNMAAKEKEIVAAMLRIGGSAKQFGLAEEQAASLAAAFIALGKPPEVAATAINALLSKLQTAQGQTAKFQGALESIGISANQMAANISDNPQKALSDFLARLSELDDKQRSMVTMELFGQEYADDISLLVGSLETYNQALDLTANKTQNAGAMNKEFDAQMQTAGKAADQAKQSLWVLAQTLGEHLLPIIATTAGAVGDVVGAVNEFAMAFPRLTQFAVLLVSGLTALTAFRSALKLAGSFGLSAGTDIAKGFAGGKLSIDSATLALEKFSLTQIQASRDSRTLVGDLKGMARHMTTLDGLFAASMAWTLGSGVGDWLYENSELARRLGHELGRIAALTMAVFNDDTIKNVLDNYGNYNDTLAQSKRHTEQMTVATQELNQAQRQSQQTTNQANQATAEQIKAQEKLIAEYRALQAVIPELQNKMAEMETAGNKNSMAYEGLAKQVETAGKRLESLKEQATAQGWETALLTGIEQASAAFEALGLDADAFATGIDSKTNQALAAFVDVARLAEGDTVKLARAYNAAAAAAGDNAQAQVLLERNLMQVTEGNKELAKSVKQAALAQQNAKSATDAQSQALQALGINMDAVNQKMSASGFEMVNTLKAGVTAIKEQATSAESLKVALKQALDTSLAAAKTQADFKAIKVVIDEAGLSGKVTAEQMAKINAGAVGGSDAVQRLAEATKAHTTSVNTNTQATAQNTTAKADNAKATEDIAKAEEKVKQASTSRLTTYKRYVPAWVASAEQQISKLQELGATQEQVTALTEQMHRTMSMMPSASIYQMAESSARLSKEIAQQTAQFNRTKTAAEYWAKALNGAEISSNDLVKAQLALKSATTASINGIVKMDSQTLSGLQSAIDNTRRKMRDLADDAKNVADTLEATLAKMQGKEDKARGIEQAKKLNEIQDKINAAKKRGNQEEINELNRALELQRKINAEEEKQAKHKRQKAHDKQLNEQNKLIGKQEFDITKDAQRQQPTANPVDKPTATKLNTTLNIGIHAKDVADVWDKRMSELVEKGLKGFIEQLKTEAGRLAK